MWPAPPHFVQRVVLVMLRGSVFCHGRRILQWRSDAFSQVYTPLLRDNPLCTLNSNAADAAGAPTCCHLPWESRWAWPALSAASSGGRSDPRGSQFLVSECCESEQIFGVNNALSKEQETRAGFIFAPADLLHGFLHVFHGVGRDQGVQRLVFSWQHLAVFPADLPLLDGTFPPDHDFGAAFLFDVLQSVAAGNNREGKVNMVVWTRRWVQKWSLAVRTNPAHRGPISRPTKLISGYSSWGIITLSLTLVAGGLKNRKKWSVQTW